MDIILYLLQLIQYQHKQICWLLNFICRYIPLKQWAFDDSHSPKYQKFKIDELPLITDFRQDWTYKELIPYYEKRYGKKIRPISRRSECVTDMTEIKASDGKLYVSAIFDCYDLAVLGLAMDTNMKATLCEKTLDNAYRAYPMLRGAIIHSDYAEEKTMPKFSLVA